MLVSFILPNVDTHSETNILQIVKFELSAKNIFKVSSALKLFLF